MSRRPRDAVLAVSGTIALAVGAYLPWVRTNPTLPPDAEIPTIYVTGMGTGIEGIDVALLGSAGIVLAVRVHGAPERFQSLVALLTGAGTAALCVRYLFFSALVGFDATFVPALGWYLTLLGGSLLIVDGGRRVPGIIDGRETESPS